MECRDAQFYLRLRRHAADELGPDVTAALDGHCAGCPACAADGRAALSFDRALSTAMRAVTVPSGLRERLLIQAGRAQGAVLRRKAYRYGGMAAAALLLVGIGLSVISKVRPEVSGDSLVELSGKQFSDPEESTREFLAKQKLPDRLPLAFDYKLFASHGFESVGGLNVPVVTFRTPTEFAKVYIFPTDGRFDLKILQDAQGSHARAQVLVGQERFRGATYVFVHTGPDLRPFLRTRNGGGNPA